MAFLTGELRFERWTPPATFNCYVPASFWTKVCLDGVVLSNCLERMVWTDPVVECSTCPECAMSGPACHARVSAFGQFVFWQAPQSADVSDYGYYDSWQEFCARCTFEHAVVFTPEQWLTVRQQCRSVPPAEGLFPLRRGDLKQVLLNTETGRLSLKKLSTQFAADLPLRIIAADPLDLESTEQKDRELETWFAEDPLAEMHGRLEPLADTDAVVQQVYLDPTLPEAVSLFDVQ